jgi:hypothetical protein
MSDTNFASWVGQTVKRKDRKAFKPGQKVAVVKAVTVNPATNNEAFTFTDTDVIVDCARCYISKAGVEQ